MQSEHQTPLSRRQQVIVAVLCLCAGAATLAPRWTNGELAKVLYGLAIAVVLLVATLLIRRSPALNRFWELSFAFFIFAIVQVLNNSVPHYIGTSVLHQPPVHGNPLASTVSGSVVIQLVETLIAMVPIIALTKAAGLDLNSIYVRRGKLGRRLAAAIAFFAIMCIVTARIPSHHVLKTHGTLTLSRVLVLAPALIAVAILNGFQEELLFRGLFLRKYNAFFGPRIANVLQATIFAVAHVGITYSASSFIFIVLIVFPLGLLLGYVMRTTDGILAPAIFHAGGDLPIYLAFFSYVR